MDLNNKLKNIKLVVSDFDGVMTDGTVLVDQNGVESVRCSRKDGLGVKMLQKAGIKVMVISKETNPVVSARCNKLGIDCVQGVEDSTGKSDILQQIIAEKKLTKDEVLYIGDDLNDLEAIRFAGVSVVPADGHPILKKSADCVAKNKGGEHVFREVSEMILSAQEIDLVY